MTAVILQAWLANIDGYLTPSQVQNWHRKDVGWEIGYKGMPFLGNATMWTDFFVISPVLGTIISNFFWVWHTEDMIASLCFGFVASFFLHFLVYAREGWNEAHVHDGKPTPVGWVHLGYQSVALGVLIQFYFFTPSRIEGVESVAPVISLLLFGHLVLGTHIIPFLRHKAWFFGGNPMTDAPSIISVLAGGLLLLWRTSVLMGWW
jgi:hypothetical protein